MIEPIDVPPGETTSQFLESLTRENRSSIAFVSREMGGRLSLDYISNECTQAFRISAHKAMKTWKPETGSNLQRWCRSKGLYGVRDFVRADLGLRSQAKTALRVSVKPFAEVSARDPQDYEQSITSFLTIKKFIETLSSLDRSILSFLVFGYDENGPLKISGRYGAIRTRPSADIAYTLQISESCVFSRLAFLRKKFTSGGYEL